VRMSIDRGHAGTPPTPFEVATGILYGTVPLPPTPSRATTPRAALEAAVLPSLLRAPCVIAFSGGRDSSALLAVAVDLARREGLPTPIPVTLEFASTATVEREWQERVLAHLGLQDWVRLAVSDELDLVGPVAARGLRRHGVLYPANAHVIVPIAEERRGGSVLTGVGGDDIFGAWPWHDLAGLFAGRRTPNAADIRRCAHLLSPLALRAGVLRRREPLALPWLREPARREAAARIARELSSAPRTWNARILWSARWRAWRATARSLELLGANQRGVVSSPFLDPGFLATLARAGGRWGWGDRTATMRALFNDVLPDAVLSRRGKAEFSESLFGVHTKRFAQEWAGRSGVDATLVDADVLRQVWSARQPHFLSAMALQSAWLASDRRASSGDERPELAGVSGGSESR
jgi:asparagine synthetase B (glutamine-hydrolysing)